MEKIIVGQRVVIIGQQRRACLLERIDRHCHVIVLEAIRRRRQQPITAGRGCLELGVDLRFDILVLAHLDLRQTDFHLDFLPAARIRWLPGGQPHQGLAEMVNRIL